MSSDIPQHGGDHGIERRLATILAADVAGYSRMMGENEEATIQTLRGHRAIFDALLKQYHGRVFNTAGDAILAEFPSAVEAVRCATEIQAALESRNAQLAPDRKMLFRMGINLGDVIVQGTDLLGDGVNVAARIQTVAAPGGICISGSVHDQILNKLSLQFNSMGDQNFKNIARPVRTFTVTHGEMRALPVAAPPAKQKSAHTPLIAAIAAIAIVALAGAGFWASRGTQTQTATTPAVAPPIAQASPAPASVPAVAPVPADGEKKVVEASAAAPPAAKHPAAAAVDTAMPFDGTYDGEICNFPRNEAKKKCWDVRLTVRKGLGNGTWSGRENRQAEAHVTISAQGLVTVALAGWTVKGEPLAGSLSGRLKDDTITANGQWANGIHVSGRWSRAP